MAEKNNEEEKIKVRTTKDLDTASSSDESGGKFRVSKFDDEESSSPEWDDEKWQNRIDVNEEDETDRPDWDEEKWRSARTESEGESELDRPEWDEEKWKLKSLTKGTMKDLEDSPEFDKKKVAATESWFGRYKSKILGAMDSWWSNAKLRNGSIVLVGAGLFLVVLFPSFTAYPVLNTVGVRSKASIKVIDAETKLPLRNVEISVMDKMSVTDEMGFAQLGNIRLGRQEVKVRRSAYQEYTKNIVVGLGGVNLGEVELVAIGSRFNFRIVDWLSKEPITDAEVSYEGNGAYSSEDGLVSLVLPSDVPSVVDVMANAPEYAVKFVSLDTTNTDVNEVELVVSKKHIFVSERNGKKNIYSVMADGSDEKLVLEAVGKEGDEMRFAVSPKGDRSILVAKRDLELKNADGFVLSGLFVVDNVTGEYEKIDESERVDIVGWLRSDVVVYVKIQAGASGKNPERHRLVAHNVSTGESHQIASSNYFNDVLVANDEILYAPSDAYKSEPEAYLYKSDEYGNKTLIHRTNVWTIVRTDYSRIAYDSNQEWYDTSPFGSSAFTINKLESKPGEIVSRLYSDSPNGKFSVWVKLSDGKGSLMLRNLENGEEKEIKSQTGLRGPITWLSDRHLVYRVVTENEVSDFVININGQDSVSEPNKISDVLNISGADRWYYY